MKKNYVNKDVIERLKQIDLLTFKQRYEPYDLERCGRSYKLKSHDSLKISNGKWCWHSQDIGGRSALDYLIKVREMSFIDAVYYLMELEAMPIQDVSQSLIEEQTGSKVELILPTKNNNNNRMIRYLLSRKIFRCIIDFFIEKELIYEEAKHHNIVFVGRDDKGQIVHASVRSTGAKRIIYDVEGSNKSYAFSYSAGKNKSVHVFEGAIDLLSYMTLMELYKKDWRSENFLSVDGISGTEISEKSNMKIPKSLEKYLEIHPEICEIILHLDNDLPGQNASEKLKVLLESKYKIINSPPVEGKDVNEFLVGIFKKIS